MYVVIIAERAITSSKDPELLECKCKLISAVIRGFTTHGLSIITEKKRLRVN